MQRLIDGINRVMREQLSGIRVIRAFAREPFERNRFAEANRALSDTALIAGRWQALMLPVTTLVINISSVALIWFGGLRIDDGQMQVGSLIAFLSYFMQILMAVLLATFILILVPRASACAERITEVLSTEPVITSPANPVRPPTVDGAIRLHDATFSYPGADRPVLQDVSLTAEPGTTTAIVGSTGSGKSTLVSLICRMYDVTAGSVRVDDVDVRDYDTEQLWSAIGLVPQRGYLFSGTVADNLRYGKADATDDEMWEALRVASADGFVRAHADGLGMPVAQGGINFSGGQRQRLAIARAVIRRPAIYLFDDAFSALDVHTDARVRAALSEVSADSTVVIVAATHFDGGRGRSDHRHRRRQGGRAPGRTSRCWPTAPPTPSSPIRRRSAPASGAGHDRAAGASDPRDGAGARRNAPATSRARPIRLVKRLTPQRGPTAAVILLGIGGIAIGVIGPRILGHATDLLFNGVIGRQLPAGLTKEQAIEAARARGDNTFADLLSGMNVVPGPRRGLRRRRTDAAAGARAVSGCRAAGLAAGAAAQRGGAADHGRAAVRCRGQAAPAAAVLLRLPAARRGAEPGHQRHRQHLDVAVDDDQPAADLAADRGRGAGDDADDLAAADAAHGGHVAVVAVRHPRDRAALATAVRRAVGQHRPAQRAHRGDLQRLHRGQDVRPPRACRRSSSASSTTTSTRPASAHSSSPAWSRRRPRSSATSAMSRWRWSAASRWRPGQITLGSIQAFIQYVRQFNQPLTQVAGMYNTLQSGMASAERVFDLLDAEEESPDPPAALPSPRRAARPGRVPARQLRATGPAPRSSRTCRWWPSPAARSRSSGRPVRARPRWSTC